MVYKSVVLFTGSADQCGPKHLIIRGFRTLFIHVWEDSDNTTQNQTHILGETWAHDPNVQGLQTGHPSNCAVIQTAVKVLKVTCVHLLNYNAHILWSNGSLLTEQQVSLVPCYLVYLACYLCSSLQNKHNPHPNNKTDNYLLQKWHRNILCFWYSTIICFPRWINRPVPFV